MPDKHHFTAATVEPWGKRVVGSFLLALFGLILGIGACVLLTWNESRAIRRENAILEAERVAITVDPTAIRPANKGKLVYFTAKSVTRTPLRDGMLGISVSALVLEREVEMYQWEETVTSRTKQTFGGETETTETIDYDPRWAAEAIDSSHFRQTEGHTNPPFAVRPLLLVAKDAKAGAFRLSPEIISLIYVREAIQVTVQHLRAASGTLRPRLQIHEGDYYLGKNAQAPEIGDEQISFKVLKTGDIAVLGRQEGDTLVPYETSSGPVLLASTGAQSLRELVAGAQRVNQLTLWLLRLAGWILAVCASFLLFSPIVAIGRLIPPLGGLMEAGATLIALSVGTSIALVVMAVAWFSVRPLWSIGLAVGAIVLFFFLSRKRAEKPAKKRTVKTKKRAPKPRKKAARS